jgi:glycerophosphoryl diester phosphodiesterase
MARFLIYAHRGASDIRPENTLPAFAAAVAQGANGIECDVQLTRDGHAVIIHDYTLNRTTNGHGKVADHTLKQIKSLSAGAWFSPRYKNVRVPTLDEVLKKVKKTDLMLNVEMKNFPILQQGLEEKVAELIAKYNLYEQTIVSSFIPASLAKLKKINRKIQTALLYFGRLEKPWLLARELNAQFVHPPPEQVSEEYVDIMQKKGIFVCPYRVDEKETIAKMITCGVNGVITTKPALVARSLGK